MNTPNKRVPRGTLWYSTVAPAIAVAVVVIVFNVAAAPTQLVLLFSSLLCVHLSRCSYRWMGRTVFGVRAIFPMEHTFASAFGLEHT